MLHSTVDVNMTQIALVSLLSALSSVTSDFGGLRAALVTSAQPKTIADKMKVTESFHLVITLDISQMTSPYLYTHDIRNLEWFVSQ